MGLFGNNNNISPKEAKKMMDEGGKFVLLDVRTPSEFAQVRIKGAKLIPVDEIGERAEAELPEKDVPILVYCHSGMRAGSAAKMLKGMGYVSVYNFGGIVSWPYETVRG